MPETPERCPNRLCGSSIRSARNNVQSNYPGEQLYRCPDPWHDAPPQPLPPQRKDPWLKRENPWQPAPGGFEEALTRECDDDPECGLCLKCMHIVRAAHAAEVEAARQRLLRELANLDALTVEEAREGTELGASLAAMLQVERAAGIEEGRREATAVMLERGRCSCPTGSGLGIRHLDHCVVSIAHRLEAQAGDRK